MNTSRQPTKRTRTRTANNRTTTGVRISDALWAVFAPLLPVQVNTHRFGGGRPRVPDRRCADASFYVLRPGCPWAALNQPELCAQTTAHDRVQEWVESDVFLNLWQAGLEPFDELQGIDWHGLSMDGAMTQAPLGGKKPGPKPTDRAQAGVKRRLLTEGHGVPMGLAVEGANRHDMQLVRSTIDRLVVERPMPTEAQPQGICLDKGDDDQEGREILEACGVTAPIRSRGEEAQAIKDKANQNARRWVVERNHL